jgi:carbonic anhydrase/acetyltransferase-like protein (isoleucine patch superfamily)
MPIITFQGKTPKIGQGVFIAPTAYVIGDVIIGDNVTIFFGSVLRGDINPIIIGSGTNIQENALLHTSRGLGPCELEEEVTVGHGAILHGCKVCNRALIGMNATVLDEAIIGKEAIVAAAALVRTRMEIPAGMLAAGVPAKIIREANSQEREFIDSGVAHYINLSADYIKTFDIN